MAVTLLRFIENSANLRLGQVVIFPNIANSLTVIHICSPLKNLIILIF